MTDIVERLRGKVPMAWGDEGFMLVDEDAVFATFTEAADEIERLRLALREITTPAYEYLSDAGAAKHKIKIARAALGEKE